jgi:hypothetical protein
MEELTPDEKRPLRLSHLQFALAANGAIQFLAVAFTSLALDGGFSGRICLHATTAYWLMVGWLALRPGKALTTVDGMLIRIGFFLWLPVAVMVEAFARKLFFGGL